MNQENMYESLYNYNTPSGDVADPAAIAGGIFFLMVFTVVAYAISAFLLSRVFKKAGVPEWAAWVPVYNMWKLLEMGNQQGFWAIFAFIPFIGFVSLIFLYLAMYEIGKKLGKEGWFVLLAIFLPVVWMIWLGFDDSKWPKSQKNTKKNS